MLEDLRSPRSYTHENLLVLDEYALIFKAPNTVVVINQDQSGNWQIANKLTIHEISEYTQFKMYKFEKQAIMLLFGAR